MAPTPTPFGGGYRGRTVLVTGNTGFKGAWLCRWLLRLGARPVGFALAPELGPSLFAQLDLARDMEWIEGDVRDASALDKALGDHRPDFVFHLAAQAIVRRSYREPADTFATNLLGTVNLLDALRKVGGGVAAVMVTSDKCYENREWDLAYREEDPLGGRDPYSASKACAEIAVGSFIRSYFADAAEGPWVATARAGNVIGGGDWAEDRIVPDMARANMAGEPLRLRNPRSTRPWQHVLDCLSGYLALGARLKVLGDAGDAGVRRFCGPMNFGPEVKSNRPVGELVAEFFTHWPGRMIDGGEPGAPHEAGLLNLATDRAFHRLSWSPTLDFAGAVRLAALWYREAAGAGGSEAIRALTDGQLDEYVSLAQRKNLPWATGVG